MSKNTYFSENYVGKKIEEKGRKKKERSGTY